jgi:hypothetical protein
MGISPEQLRVLLSILRDSTWRSRDFVEKRFQERARNFSETLAFLQQIGWVHGEGLEVQIADAWNDRTPANGDAVALLDALLDSPGRHQQELASYLLRFRCANGVPPSFPSAGFDFSDSPARDFLMELGAVRHDGERRVYVIERPFLGAYMWALAQRGPDSREELLTELSERQLLGYQAEIAVIKFERQRLGPTWADRIHHIAGDHPTAPYDIKSVTVTDNRASPRYIEVKAVALAERQFFWSASEIEAAKLLQLEYYLYLVPVTGRGDLDLAQLQMIADPYSEIYSRPSVWEKLPTNFLCRPAKV